MLILYGSGSIFADVTQVCLDNKIDDRITIPGENDERTIYFGIDPCPNVDKIVKIVDDYGTIKNYPHFMSIEISLIEGKYTLPTYEISSVLENEAVEKLRSINEKSSFKHSSLDQEIPDEIMAIMFIKKNAKVLEIGTNIGRNTFIISSLLEDDTNLVIVTMEYNINNRLQKICENKQRNFHVENSPLSKKILIQHGSNTYVTEDLSQIPDGFTVVPTIDWETLKNKYQIEFDTLVLDCEGAFYQILVDMENILDNIQTIVIENDFTDIEHKRYVDQVLSRRGFICIYTQSGGFDPNDPCYNFFYQVFKKINT